MPNNEIIEAMARAHCESEAYEKGYLRDGAWSDGLTNNDRQTRVKHMRAALRAMAEREPTVAVHEAIRNAMVNTQFASSPLATGLAVWRALLLAAAEEE